MNNKQELPEEVEYKYNPETKELELIVGGKKVDTPKLDDKVIGQIDLVWGGYLFKDDLVRWYKQGAIIQQEHDKALLKDKKIEELQKEYYSLGKKYAKLKELLKKEYIGLVEQLMIDNGQTNDLAEYRASESWKEYVDKIQKEHNIEL